MKAEVTSYKSGTSQLTTDRQQTEPVISSPAAVVTFLFVRLTEIAGPGIDALARPEELVSYQEIIAGVGAQHGAITRRLDASSALLLFPAVAPAESPSRQGVHAAVALREQLEELNQRRLATQQTPYRIGIGVHTGTLSPGSERITALHHGIQDAEGLSLLNRQAPFPAVFVSKSVLQGLGHLNGYQVQNLGEVFAPNQPKALTVYALM